MTTSKAVPAILAILVLAMGPATADAAGAKETLCPAAADAVDRFAEVGKANDPKQIAGVAKELTGAYSACALQAQSTGKRLSIEPTMHYDLVRAAQFGFVLGRALAEQGDRLGAVAAFRSARTSATNVADWRYDPGAYFGGVVDGVADKGPSRYHDAAVAIRSAIDTELLKLSAPANAPSPGASPAP